MTQGEVDEATELRPGDLDPELENYHALSAWAVVGLLASLLAPIAFVGAFPALWSIVSAGICLIALRKIAVRSPELSGRGLALAGLAISVFCLFGSQARGITRSVLLRMQGEQVTQQFFEALRNGEPQKAHQLTLDVAVRVPADQQWAYYGSRFTTAKQLRDFTAEPHIRALLELGSKAQVRRYRGYTFTGRMPDGRMGDGMADVYAVTYDEGGQKKTFFIRLVTNRTINPVTGEPEWQIFSHKGGRSDKGQDKS